MLASFEGLLPRAWNFKMYRYKVKRQCFNTYALGWCEVVFQRSTEAKVLDYSLV